MPAANFRNVLLGAAGLAVAAFGPGAFAQEMTAAGEVFESSQSVQLYAVEGNDLPVQIAIDMVAIERTDAITLTSLPMHGDYVGQAWPNFIYKPGPGFFGYDHLALQVEAGGQTFAIEYEITVLPARIPLAGPGNGDPFSWPSLYAPQGGWLQQCTGIEQPEATPDGDVYWPLVCYWSRVVGAPAAALAFTMPGANGNASRLALFAPATGTLYDLVPSGADFLALPGQVVAEAIGRFPLAGAFRAGEPVTMAFASRHGEVGMIGSDGRWTEWVQPLAIPHAAGDDLVWPVVLPYVGADGLALVEAGTGKLQLLAPNGERFLWAPIGTPPPDTRRPFGAVRGYKTARVPTLVAKGDRLFISDLHYGTPVIYDPSPQTYPLKFPDDPPGP